MAPSLLWQGGWARSRCLERKWTLAVQQQQAQASGPGSGAAAKSVPSSGALRNMILVSNFLPTLVVPLVPDDTRPRKLMVTAAWPYRQWIG